MFKIGSLFDGSGGFPLAASLCGITPTWASEIEPYPIAVTRSRFPNMQHLGDISKINGAEIEPVDIISFGSPCQDLSVAGKRAGLKHTENGDDETTRSGLFMEAVRIIKEMRKATNGNYPRFAVWENVPGAFSSNKGEDFRIVLEELIKVVEPAVEMPAVPGGKWPYEDCYVGDGWSIAYRTLDAQFWGVPQRRRRIYLVADFRSERAEEILFEREGLRGYFTQGSEAEQGTARDSADRSGAADRTGECVTLEPGIAAREGGHIYEGVCGTLRANMGDNQMAVAYSIENHPADSRVNIDHSGKVQTLTSRMGTGGGNVPMVMEQKPIAFSFDSLASNSMKSKNPHSGCRQVEVSKCLDTTDPNPCKNQGGIAVLEPTYCLQGSMIGRDDKNGPQGDGVNEETSFTLNTIDRHAVAYQYIVRRLTPTECARLQGFPDKWGHPDRKEDFTEEEYRFWLEVRNTHAAINGKQVKDYTKQQMLTWYNKLHTDSSEYKMWGNGIALPTALYAMQGISDALFLC